MNSTFVYLFKAKYWDCDGDTKAEAGIITASSYKDVYDYLWDMFRDDLVTVDIELLDNSESCTFKIDRYDEVKEVLNG